MKYKNTIQKYLLIVLLSININSCFGMEYFRQLKDSIQEFWSKADTLQKTLIIGGIGVTSLYVFSNEWRHHQKNVRINDLKDELANNHLVTAAIAYGGFDTSWNEILCNLQNEKDGEYSSLFAGNNGLGDHHQNTYNLLTTNITGKVKRALFYHAGSPGDLVNDRLNDIERTLFGKKYTYQSRPSEPKDTRNFFVTGANY